jgi:hypothetical protein
MNVDDKIVRQVLSVVWEQGVLAGITNHDLEDQDVECQKAAAVRDMMAVLRYRDIPEDAPSSCGRFEIEERV